MIKVSKSIITVFNWARKICRVMEGFLESIWANIKIKRLTDSIGAENNNRRWLEKLARWNGWMGEGPLEKGVYYIKRNSKNRFVEVRNVPVDMQNYRYIGNPETWRGRPWCEGSEEVREAGSMSVLCTLLKNLALPNISVLLITLVSTDDVGHLMQLGEYSYM